MTGKAVVTDAGNGVLCDFHRSIPGKTFKLAWKECCNVWVGRLSFGDSIAIMAGLIAAGEFHAMSAVVWNSAKWEA